ncbi:uncharacterized protein P884DRAFT_216874 [Thermothelomyces heterothallicus CBS 202.75]|uniref:uncharacterized protein n=1 Tax=Thermothelomyces heterothallicus CBS 202.75 TaxID=1149848 RepID=UPI0037444380
MLSALARPITSTTLPSYSSDSEMGASEPVVDCNLPELLVKDLATSEDTFRSKAMTAGCPYAGLAAPSREPMPSFRRPLVPCRGSSQGRPMGTRRSLMNWLVAEGPDACAEELDENGHLGSQEGCPDSSNAASIGMALSLARTRQQSVATAATSDSGRCSSLFSHNNALSPTPPVFSPSLRRRESSPHSTWYEDEPDSPRERPGSSVFTAGTSISDPHRPVTETENDSDNDMAKEKRAADGHGIPSVTAEAFSSEGGCATRTRPRTPGHQAHPEKPRLVDIPPARTAERRGTLSNGNSLQASCGSVSLIETATGRTVINASAPPPPIAFANRSQALHHSHARPSSATATDATDREDEALDTGRELGAGACAQSLGEARKPSLVDLRRLVDAGAETLASSQKSTPYTPSLPIPGIPLPPEIVESLRVSISCFPETMLLTSSLSVETIRAYSKKFRHRVDTDCRLRAVDTGSAFFPSASQNHKPPRRWNMGWLGHSPRSNKQDQFQPPRQRPQRPQRPSPQQQQYSYAFPRGNRSSPFATSNLTLSGAESLTPTWVAIKNIFPSASDHLCDALYAHLLVYNYIVSLAPPRRPQPSFQATPAEDLGASAEGGSLGIPQKAASLLGMDDPVSAATTTACQHHHQHHRHHQQEEQPPTPPRRRALSRSRGRRRISYYPPAGLTPSPAGLNAGGGGSGGSSASSAAMGELLAGLRRCVHLLVATMRTTAAAAPGDGQEEEALADEVGSILFGSELNAERVEAVEPVLVRALCEVVRCAEEGSLGGL